MLQVDVLRGNEKEETELKEKSMQVKRLLAFRKRGDCGTSPCKRPEGKNSFRIRGVAICHESLRRCRRLEIQRWKTKGSFWAKAELLQEANRLRVFTSADEGLWGKIRKGKI